MVDNAKNIFVFGKSGEGKSFLLNLLEKDINSEEEGDIGVFKTSEGERGSCTSSVQFTTSYLFNNNQNPYCNFIDLPGFYDTKEKADKEKDENESIAFETLMSLEKELNRFNNQAALCLLCVNAMTQVDDAELKSVVEIAKMISGDSSRILLCVSNYTCWKGNAKVNKVRDFNSLVKEEALGAVYFLGSHNKDWHKDTPPQDLVDRLRYTSNFTMKTWNEMESSQKKDIEQIFDFVVKEEGENHSGTECFSLDMTIMTFGVEEKLRSVQVNQKVSFFFKFNEIKETKDIDGNWQTICGIIHSSDFVEVEFLEITTTDDDGKHQLEITKNHLLLIKKQNEKDREFRQSKELCIGDFLVRQKSASIVEFIESKIIQINIINKRGFMAPLTTSGIIVVNNFICSCYCYSSHQIAHAVAKPYIYYCSIKEKLKLTNNPQKLEINPYFKMLQKIEPWIMNYGKPHPEESEIL